MKLLLFLCMLFTILCGFSQSITPEVVSSSGGDASSTNSQVSWTIGEPIVTSETGTNAIITQGFQQPEDIANSVSELFEESGINAFPNPVLDQLTIELPETYLSATIRIFDSKGALVRTFIAGANYVVLDLSGLTKGIYIMHIINSDQAQGLKFDKL